jgi:hypothetical protein
MFFFLVFLVGNVHPSIYTDRSNTESNAIPRWISSCPPPKIQDATYPNKLMPAGPEIPLSMSDHVWPIFGPYMP